MLENMALSFRAGFSKLLTSSGLCKFQITSTNNVSKNQVARISTLEVRKTREPRPEPFPYKTKPFGLLSQMFDDTIFRFDDNTKIILVEGPPALGKTDLCKKLAQELDMLYVPPAVLEDYYVHNFDFDLRTIDDKLPESCRTVSLDTFFKNPSLKNGGCVQFLYYHLRFRKFIQILAHVLSTGQGVVTERSPWSDMCFAKAMHLNGYLSPNAYTLYNTMIDQSLHELMRPHLVLYLDAPVNIVMEKMKKQNNPDELKIINEKFLTDLEKSYKFDFLKTINQHAHLIVYDYSNGGDFEVVVEDIETLNFDGIKEGKKFEDWHLETNVMWTDRRRKYAETEDEIMQYLRLDQMIAEELTVSASDMRKRHLALKENAPRQVWDSFYCPAGMSPKKLLEERQ